MEDLMGNVLSFFEEVEAEPVLVQAQALLEKLETELAESTAEVIAQGQQAIEDEDLLMLGDVLETLHSAAFAAKLANRGEISQLLSLVRLKSLNMSVFIKGMCDG